MSSEITVFVVLSMNLSQLSVMFRIFSLSPVIRYYLFEFKSQTLLDNTFFSVIICDVMAHIVVIIPFSSCLSLISLMFNCLIEITLHGEGCVA